MEQSKNDSAHGNEIQGSDEVSTSTNEDGGVIKDLNGELESAKKIATEAENKIATLTKEIEVLNDKLNDAGAVANRVEELEQELAETKDKLNEAQDQLQESKKELESTNSEFATIKNQLEAKEEEISSLKSKIESIEGTKQAQKIELDELHKKTKEMENEIASSKSQKESVKELQEEVKVLRILASTESRALDMYNVLKGHQSLNLRKLAMQSGMSAQAAKQLVEGLEKAGLVKIEREGIDDTDPKISLVN